MTMFLKSNIKCGTTSVSQWYECNDVFTKSVRLDGDYKQLIQWRHNERNGVSVHLRLDGLVNRLFRPRRKKISKLCVTGLFGWNSPVIGEFPSQKVSNKESVSIWWRHHVFRITFVFLVFHCFIVQAIVAMCWLNKYIALVIKNKFRPSNPRSGILVKKTCILVWLFNTLRPGQNGCHLADASFKCFFLNENVCISIIISLKFVPKGPINNISALVQIMATAIDCSFML